jgi:hypothetical protein
MDDWFLSVSRRGQESSPMPAPAPKQGAESRHSEDARSLELRELPQLRQPEPRSGRRLHTPTAIALGKHVPRDPKQPLIRASAGPIKPGQGFQRARTFRPRDPPQDPADRSLA